MFSSVQSLSHVQLLLTPWTTAHQASLSITNSRSSPKPMSIESVMPSNHLTLCRPLLLLPSIFCSIRVFSNESALRIHRVRRMFINRTYACEIFFGQQWLFEYHRLLLKMMSLYFKLDNKIKQCIIFSLAMATICKIYTWQRLLNVCQYPFLSIPSSF